MLLTPAQINPLMGATGIAIIRKHDAMSDDSATMRPKECLAIDGSAQAQVYANSGFTAVRDQELNDGDNFTHYAEQAVVLFPTVKQAQSSSSARACAGRPAISTPTPSPERSGTSGRYRMTTTR